MQRGERSTRLWTSLCRYPLLRRPHTSLEQSRARAESACRSIPECPILSLGVAMEAGSQVGVMQKLLDRLCQETDPGTIYKMLKKLSSVPILCDSLEEIGFRQTIKCLKKQQLLVPFAKDLVAKWSTGFLLGPQPEQIKQDVGLVMSFPKEHQSNSPEEKPQVCASQEPRGTGREVFLGFSSLGPGRISYLNPNAESHTRSYPRAPQSRSLDGGENWSPEQQLAGQNQLQQVGSPTARMEEPRQQEGAKPLSRKPGVGPGKFKWPVFGGHGKSQPPGHSEQEETPGSGSVWPGLHDECCSPSSWVVPASKKKRELPGLAEVQRPPAKLPRGESRSSKDPSPIAAWAIPESPSTAGQDCFSWDVVQEPSYSQLDQEPSTWEWAIRKNHKTRVYSSFRRAAGLQQKSQLGLLAEEKAGTRDAARCQAAEVEAQPGQLEEKSWPETQTCKQTHSRTESPTRRQSPKFQEERLQGLRARIQSTRAKRLQDRQTRMISFHTELKSPGLQREHGPRGAASAQNSHSLPEASARAAAQRASSLLTGERGNKKAPAKRPAPLMAKAIRDYSHRFYKK